MQLRRRRCDALPRWTSMVTKSRYRGAGVGLRRQGEQLPRRRGRAAQQQLRQRLDGPCLRLLDPARVFNCNYTMIANHSSASSYFVVVISLALVARSVLAVFELNTLLTSSTRSDATHANGQASARAALARPPRLDENDRGTDFRDLTTLHLTPLSLQTRRPCARH